MKRFLLMAAVAALCLVLPGTALAGTRANGNDCGYATANGPTAVPVTAGPATAVVYAHTTPNNGGMSGNADKAVGACLNVQPAAPVGPYAFGGGAVEAGNGADDSTVTGDGSGTYAVIDGDNQNLDPTGQGDGYIGLSNYEDSPPQGDCNSATGAGTNSGGCLIVAGQRVAADGSASPVVCGNTSGPTWANTSRDGCDIP
jgi:hypothetical protein